MRQIKFRCWDKKREKIFELKNIDLHIDYVNCGHGLPMQDSQCLPFKEIEVMQYIGLKDKNGKEIYEGDIIRYNRHITQDYSEEVIGLIEYINCGFWITKAYSYNIQVTSDCEIIGNIFENPDLLKWDD